VSFTPIQKLFQLQRQISRDSEVAEDELHKRDRKLALEAAEQPDQLSYWLSSLTTADDKALLGQVESGLRLVSFGMIVLGLLLGSLTVAGLFQYDGAGRVDLVWLLVVFVVLQLLFVLLTVIALLPGSSSAQQMLAWFSPARLQRLFLRLAPEVERRAIAQLLGRNQKLFGQMGKWQLFSWSQLFGVAFNSAALITLFVLIAVKDIAFGWSTTLSVEPEVVLQITNLLSWPWQSWLPSEVPSLSLVEASRYFRLQELTASTVQPELLGQWWGFLMLCLFFYGLLPRLFLMLFCRHKLGKAITRTLHYFPGRQAILDRLNSAIIETQAENEIETEVTHAPFEVDERRQEKREAFSSKPIILINWSHFELTEEPFLTAIQQAGRFSIKASYEAGTNCSLDVDSQVIQSIAETTHEEPIGILVKSWEPPLGELADFIEELRGVISPERAIWLLPVSVESGRLVQPEPRDSEEWQRFAKSLVDPWLSVSSIMPRSEDV
jgi:hypothetical protein